MVIFGESWLHYNVSDALIRINGYKIFHFVRKVKNNMGNTKMGATLCAYIQEGIEATHLDHYSVSNEDTEAMSLGIQNKRNKKIVLLAVYGHQHKRWID